MTVTPLVDHGQIIAPPAGKVIGFIDGKARFDAFAEAARAAGYPASSITSLYGEDGLQLLHRLKNTSFFFGDAEDSILQLSIKELGRGHYAAAVDVSDRKQAVEIANFAKPHGGHSFSYFGTWISEQLSR